MRMKKTLNLVILLFALMHLQAQNDTTIHHRTFPPIVVPTCNTNTPGWGDSLGIVSFVTAKTWTIQGTGTNAHISQIWSDAVTASVCDKVNFDGGSARSFNADCRSNPGQKGDLFSWCAVVRFQHTLCPDDWRVPTQQDFIDLGIALGGRARNITDTITRNRYLNEWGGTYGGSFSSTAGMAYQGLRAGYWSQTELDATIGRRLRFDINGFISSQGWSIKLNGHTLRCIR